MPRLKAPSSLTSYLKARGGRPFQTVSDFGLLGSIEVQGGDSRAFRKWKSVLPECDAQVAQVQDQLQRSNHRDQALDYWTGLLQSVGDEKDVHQLSHLNSRINESADYEPLATIAGYADLWRSPLKLFGGQGDCEDFAIAKYFSLIALGYPEKMLRLVVVQDTSRQVVHAVTCVQLSDQCYVLDSLRPVAEPDHKMLMYVPLTSMHRDTHYQHVVTASIRQQYRELMERKTRVRSR